MITLQKGDTEFIELSLTNPDGTPLNLAGIAQIYFTVKRRLSDPDSAAILSKSLGSGIAITDAAAGSALIIIAGADTRNLLRNTLDRDLQCDVIVVDTIGQEFQVARDTLRIESRVRVTV